jgi:hypothetical protein
MAASPAEPAVEAVSALARHVPGSAAEFGSMIQGVGSIAAALEDAIRLLEGFAREKAGMDPQTASDLGEIARFARRVFDLATEADVAFCKNHEFWLGGDD